ncbi:hypothetical protein B6K86_04400 [Lachnospiraceae bacterium]|nr:hypothetical protein B6K86_04400 [Lachnospiraceae bacterium]
MKKILISSILAGLCIALGGSVFLSVENKLVGAVFFTVGLYTICTMRFHLFTGRVCYVLQQKPSDLLTLPVIWIGNLMGTGVVALAERQTRIGAVLQERAGILAAAKLNDHVISIFILSMLCNMLIYIAVEEYASNPHEIGKYLGLFFGVMVFILCGFEHCIANMYYFFMAGQWTGKTVVYLLLMTAGNAVGGVLLCLLKTASAERG